MTLRIIAGKLAGKRLKSPKTNNLRPTLGKLREALFQICSDEVPGSVCLDLFAGTGAIGLEALSRGADHVTFVDTRCQTVRANIELLEVQANCKVIQANFASALPRFASQKKQFDLIFADPPYLLEKEGVSLGQKCLFLLDQLSLLRPNGLIFLEDGYPFDETTNGLERLVLQKSRRFGRSYLHQFGHKKTSP